MSPAEIRALMVEADQRPVTTAQVIEQARAEGMLSSWRAWLPGLLDEIGMAGLLFDPSISSDDSAIAELRSVGLTVDPIAPLLSIIRPGLASCGERVGGDSTPSAAGVHSSQVTQ